MVRTDEAYSKTEFLRRIDRKEAGWRSLKRAGLRTIQVAGGAFVLGEGWLEFLASTTQGRVAGSPAELVSE